MQGMASLRGLSERLVMAGSVPPTLQLAGLVPVAQRQPTASWDLALAIVLPPLIPSGSISVSRVLLALPLVLLASLGRPPVISRAILHAAAGSVSDCLWGPSFNLGDPQDTSRALQRSATVWPRLSICSAVFSLRMICSGAWRLRFLGLPLARSGRSGSSPIGC